MVEPVSLMVAWKGAMVSTMLSSACDTCITDISSYKYWWWKKHGRGSYRVLFGNNNNIEQQVIMMKFLSIEAQRKSLKDLFRFTYAIKYEHHDTATVYSINIPKCRFTLTNKLCFAIPLIGSSGDVIGYEFWTRCLFKKGSHRKYRQMVRFLHELLQDPNPLPIPARRNQISPR